MNYALSHLCVAVTAALAAAGSVSSGDVIIPDGEFSSWDGRPASVEGSKVDKWRMSAANGARLISLVKRIGRDIQVDFEHASEDPVLRAEGKAPAAGWIKWDTLRYEAGRGIVATIDWTTDAAAAIDAKKFKFISPVFYWNLLTGDVLGLKSAALTNDPAMNLPATAQLSAAVAAFARDFDSPTHDTPEPFFKQGAPVNKTALCIALGLAADTADEMILTAAAALRARVDTATPDPSKYVAQSVLSAEQTAHAETRRQLSELNARINEEGVTSAIAKAKAEGVSMTQEFEGHLASVGKTMGLATLTAMLAASPRDPVKGGKTQTNGTQTQAAGTAITSLSASQQSMARLLNVTDEAYLTQLNAVRGQGLEV